MKPSHLLLPLLFRYYGTRSVRTAAVLLTALVILVDASTWIELNVPIVFGLPLIVAGASGSRLLLWTLSAALVATTFIVYVLQRTSELGVLTDPYFDNRMLAIVTILFTAVLVRVLMAASEALRARSEMAEAESVRKTELLASVSHDLRTPLETINLLAESIRAGAYRSDGALALDSLAESLGKNVVAISDLLADALDIAALESGRVVLHESEFSLNEFFAEEHRRFVPLAEEKGLSLVVSLARPDATLRTDRVKIGRILDNLVGNAIKFTARGGVEMVADLAPDGSVLMHVRDTGLGIAVGDYDRVFGGYAKAHGRADDQGWGLGLAISRRLADLMGARLWVSSRENEGSIFSLRLPPEHVMGRRAV